MESGPCQGRSDTVLRLSCCFIGSKKSDIHLSQDELKEQVTGEKKSKRGSHKAVGNIYTTTWLNSHLCDVYV